MAVRDLLWWREAQRDALARAVEAGLSSCCEAWGLPVPKPTVQACCRIDPALEWQVLFTKQGPENQAWLGYSVQLRKDVGTALFDDADGAALSWQVLEHALLQVSDAMRSLLFTPPQPIPNDQNATGVSTSPPPAPRIPPTAHAKTWSGSLQIVFGGVWQGMVLHLAPQLVQVWLATYAQELVAESVHTAARHQMQRLTPILDAINAIVVPLQVSLADIELDLGSLQSLTPDAVVRLTHALTQPFDVCTSDGSVVCTGYLGQSGSRRALGLQEALTSSNSQE